MTNKMIENRIRKIYALEQRKTKLNEEIEKAKGELIAEMARKKTEILTTDTGTTARYQHITTNRVDSQRFREELPELYEHYLTPNTTHRFTWKLMEG